MLNQILVITRRRTARARLVRSALAVLLAAISVFGMMSSAAASPCPSKVPAWQVLPSAGGATFRSLAAVNRKIAWIGSDSGTVLRTVNGGYSWQDVSPPATANLRFRDLYAEDAYRAVAMTAGGGSDSRVYVTANGGRTWRLAYQANDPGAFFDAMAFYDAKHGLILSDPINGKFQVLSTSNGGETWMLLPGTGMSAAQPGEFGFADSGTTITTAGREAWFSSGGSVSRIFHSSDGGLHWDVKSTPILHGSVDETAGIYGLAFRTPALGLAVGGDFETSDVTVGVSAISRQRGPWLSPAREPSGVRFAAAWLPFTEATAVTVGINGSDVSYDAGQHWTRFDSGEFNTVSCANDGTCWAAGDSGRVALFRR